MKRTIKTSKSDNDAPKEKRQSKLTVDYISSGGDTAKLVDHEVQRARKEGTYDMEFLESNGDLDPKTWQPYTKQEDLDKAYAKYLKENVYHSDLDDTNILANRFFA